jgi:hypothetical protein
VFSTRPLRLRTGLWLLLSVGPSLAPVAAQQPNKPVTPETIPPAAAPADNNQEEHKRIFGVLPNFNSVSNQATGPITPGHKMRLAFRTAVDPFSFFVAGVSAGLGQAQNSYAPYGQGAEGYGKRFGAAYVDSFDGTMIGNGLLPIVFRQDPRYFRKGTGTFWNRFAYALLSTVRSRSDSGHWMPNYANILGNVAAGGIANAYYPDSDRGAGLTFQRAATVTGQGALGTVVVEFWPDIASHLHRKKKTPPSVP